LKAQLHKRFGASVAETGHHELWQRSTLLAALAGRDAGPLEKATDDLERYILSCFPETVRFERALVSTQDVVLGE
jgi:uncharacterized protein YlxP (DUF503 family)